MRAAAGEKSPSLLVLGAGPAQLGLLEAARAHGIWTAVCDRDPAAPGFALAGRRCIVSTDDEPAIERLALALLPDGLIAPGGDPPVAVAARIADKLGLPHPLSPATAQLVAAKLRRRQTLAACGVPQPRWQVAAAAGAVELGPPLLVEAADRAGAAVLVREPGELAAALAAARAQARGGAVLVSELVEGPEVSVTGFSAGGELVPLAATDRIPDGEGAPFGLPLACSWPSPHAEAAAEVTRRAVEALGIAEGPTLTTLRVSRGGPEVIEVSARLAGGAEAELVELVTGIDLNGLALAAALGRPLAASEIRASFRSTVGGAATRFLLAPSGPLASVEVPEGLKGVVSTRIYRPSGSESGSGPGPGLPRPPSDLAGAVLAAGASAQEALARVDAAVERIRLRVADAEATV